MTTFCSKCGNALTADVNFCSKCGAPTSSYYSNSSSSPYEPTVPASPSKTPPQIPSTDYGSNPYGIGLPNPYGLSPLMPPPPPPSRRNKRFGILIGTGLLVLMLASVGVFTLLTQGARNKAMTALTTATSIPNGTLLYNADWSSGLNGWTGTSDWTVLNGVLHNDGTDSSYNSPTIVAPYQVEGIPNYAVEVNIQVVAGGSCFDVSTIRASGSGNVWQGYKATICAGNAVINAGNIAGVSFDRLAQVHFDVGNTWHIYRFEAKGTRLSFLIDGKLVLGVDDSRYSSGGRLGFKSSETQLNVSSFKVFAL